MRPLPCLAEARAEAGHGRKVSLEQSPKFSVFIILRAESRARIIYRTFAPGLAACEELTLDAISLETDIELGVWAVTGYMVRQYLGAVADTNWEYFVHRQVPPLALAAYALGALLERLNLPPGAIHSLQEVETLQGVGFGEEIKATARLERPRRRGDLEFISASYFLDNSLGERVQTGKSTVLISRPGPA